MRPTARWRDWRFGLVMVALLLAAVSPAFAQQATPVTVTLTVTGLRNTRGHVRIAAYRDARRWLQDDGVVARCIATPHAGQASCTIVLPAAGRYAFAGIHDEDDDRAMAKDMIGLPQEGFIFSNHARPGLSAPGFDSAAVTVSAGTTLDVSVQYGL